MTEREQLIADLKDVMTRIGNMCANGHPPKMSIPARPDYDDDLVICATINRAIAALSEQGEPVAWITELDVVNLQEEGCCVAGTQSKNRVVPLAFAAPQDK